MKNILIAATGSVAVIKTKEVVQFLKKHFNVKVIVSDYVAQHFDKVEELDYIVENKSLSSFPEHIKLSKWADLILVVPASANTLSSFVAGLASTPLQATLIAARSPIIFVPAMNTFMYEHLNRIGIFTKIAQLGYMTIGPIVGALREGEVGLGRMADPEIIAEKVINFFQPKKVKVLIAYGGSKVYIDPIRYITNGSSGFTGKFLANEMRLWGYEVQEIDISSYTNKQFLEYVQNLDFDIYISAAAFADFDIVPANEKIHKQESLTLNLKSNIDVISSLKLLKPSAKYIGFKLDNDLQNAIDKLKKSQLDGIIHNLVSSMGSQIASYTYIDRDGEQFPINEKSKPEALKKVAELIVKKVR